MTGLYRTLPGGRKCWKVKPSKNGKRKAHQACRPARSRAFLKKKSKLEGKLAPKLYDKWVSTI